MMLQQANLLFLDEPTNHLDLESIQALNNGMRDFKGTLVFSSHDHTINQTVANRVIEIFQYGILDKLVEFDDFISDQKIAEQRLALAAK
jgi:ATPase subunit of ABC transporter with duplicated ATPase domains